MSYEDVTLHLFMETTFAQSHRLILLKQMEFLNTSMCGRNRMKE